MGHLKGHDFGKLINSRSWKDLPRAGIWARPVGRFRETNDPPTRIREIWRADGLHATQSLNNLTNPHQSGGTVSACQHRGSHSWKPSPHEATNGPVSSFAGPFVPMPGNDFTKSQTR